MPCVSTASNAGPSDVLVRNALRGTRSGTETGWTEAGSNPSGAVNSSTGTVLFNGSVVQGQIDSSLRAALGAPNQPVWMGSSQWQLLGALSSGATSANSDRGTTASGTISVSPSSVPEPSSLALLGTGLIGAAGMLRRKLRR